jgi:hypothetical protein
MKNKYTHLHNFISDIIPFNVPGGLNYGTLCFDYDFTNWPDFFGVITSYVHHSVSGVEIEILKVQTNYKIERKELITGTELYPFIDYAVSQLNQTLTEEHTNIGIPLLKAPCPSMEDMMIELENLAENLNNQTDKT